MSMGQKVAKRWSFQLRALGLILSSATALTPPPFHSPVSPVLRLGLHLQTTHNVGPHKRLLAFYFFNHVLSCNNYQINLLACTPTKLLHRQPPEPVSVDEGTHVLLFQRWNELDSRAGSPNQAAGLLPGLKHQAKATWKHPPSDIPGLAMHKGMEEGGWSFLRAASSQERCARNQPYQMGLDLARLPWIKNL